MKLRYSPETHKTAPQAERSLRMFKETKGIGHRYFSYPTNARREITLATKVAMKVAEPQWISPAVATEMETSSMPIPMHARSIPITGTGCK